MNRRAKLWLWSVLFGVLLIGGVGTVWLLSDRERYMLAPEIELLSEEHEAFRKRIDGAEWRLTFKNDGTFMLDSPFMLSPEGHPFTYIHDVRDPEANRNDCAPDFYQVPQLRPDDTIVGTYEVAGDSITLIRPPMDSGDMSPSLVPRTRVLKRVGDQVVDDLPEIAGVRLVWVLER